jgi:glycosyltransferase involved in cell wall biosynthesis
MVQPDRSAHKSPLFSIIVGVYNDWAMLGGCLQSLTQEDELCFEVIVVDDGSKEQAPESIRRWANCYPLTILREKHGGISAARNRGIRVAKGSVLVFVDADSRVQAGCLAALAATVAESPLHNFFQLHLVGDYSLLFGRAEELRLRVFQHYSLQASGCIRYLNTAGFAVRRESLDPDAGLFNPEAERGEDTLLLAELVKRGELPLFVPNASVQHMVALSFMECLRKDLRSAYLEGRTFDMIASTGVTIRMSNHERLWMLRSLWKASEEESIGRLAWFVLVGRQSLQRFISLIYWLGSRLRTRASS